MNRTRKFWEWKNLSDGNGEKERTLELNGTIAEESWYDDDVTPEIFKEELMGGAGPVTVWINSPGGDCVAASRIYTMLMDYPHDVTVKIDGIAASAASVIAMAGTKVLMSPTAMMMIHNPATVAAGDSEEMQKAIEMLSEVKESIVNAYEIKTGLSRAKLSRLMDEETWMNARKAVELGFADGILEDEKPSSEDMSPYVFSPKSVHMSLINKLKEREKAPDRENIRDLPEQGSKERTGEPQGRPIEELRARLDAMRNFM